MSHCPLINPKEVIKSQNPAFTRNVCCEIHTDQHLHCVQLAWSSAHVHKQNGITFLQPKGGCTSDPVALSRFQLIVSWYGRELVPLKHSEIKLKIAQTLGF